MVISSHPWAGGEEEEPAGNGREMDPNSQHSSLGSTNQVGTTSSLSCGSGHQICFCMNLGREIFVKG